MMHGKLNTKEQKLSRYLECSPFRIPSTVKRKASILGFIERGDFQIQLINPWIAIKLAHYQQQQRLISLTLEELLPKTNWEFEFTGTLYVLKVGNSGETWYREALVAPVTVPNMKLITAVLQTCHIDKSLLYTTLFTKGELGHEAGISIDTYTDLNRMGRQFGVFEPNIVSLISI